MLESLLWKNTKSEFRKVGKFQKTSDRFTPGIPDVLGCCDGTAYALELKRLAGSGRVRVKFRPGQLDWLEEWGLAGGVGLIVATLEPYVLVFDPRHGPQLELGVSRAEALEMALIRFLKTRTNSWSELVEQIRSIKNEEI